MIIRKPKEPSRYKVSHFQFCESFTPESVYILGLLWADGCVSRKDKYGCSIDLATTEPDDLEFEKILEKTGKWMKYRYIHKNQPTWKPFVVFKTANYYIWNFLHENDYRSKINSANKILSKIPDKLKHYWFRGLVDGDGSFSYYGGEKSKYSLTISSEYGQNWQYLIDLTKKLNIKYYISRRESKQGHKNSNFCLGNMNSCITFLDYIYQNREKDKMGLTRKYDKYLKMKKQFLTNSFVGVTRSSMDKTKWRAYITGQQSGDGIRRQIGTYNSKKEAQDGLKKYLKEKNIILKVF